LLTKSGFGLSPFVQTACPLWVISGHFAVQSLCLLCPRKRTSIVVSCWLLKVLVRCTVDLTGGRSLIQREHLRVEVWLLIPHSLKLLGQFESKLLHVFAQPVHEPHGFVSPELFFIFARALSTQVFAREVAESPTVNLPPTMG
jgi:hypothetical protein